MQLAHPFPATLPADNRARNAAIALVICGLVLLVGLVSRAWFTTRGGSVGLLGLEECRGAMCRGMSWFDVKRAPTELKLFSTIGIIGIVVALGFLAQAAVMLFRRQSQRVMMVPLNAALGIAAFGCFSFFFHLTFGEMSRKLSVSYAGLFAMGGIIAASIIIGAMVRPLARATNR
ncbi:MAG: hypothetical protein M4D80_25275 [Myxococcota bacterium]|nr:hypothetical protein [Myxococcota bacterium]